MRRGNKNLGGQLKAKSKDKKVAGKKGYEGNIETMISTGSTLLDLAISGGRVREGGMPGGILVEIFGPSGAGKTVLLCEIAGAVSRAGGEIMFKDPEARLNKQFAEIFDLDVDQISYEVPNTVPEVFAPIRTWEPEKKGKIHGIFADSLAALSTDWEMEGKDQYGMRRAKEFSEELRKTCRVLTQKNMLMVCSNQVRQNLDAGQFGQKWKSPGGAAIGFYSSLRLRIIGSEKIKKEKSIHGSKTSRIEGITSRIEVFKSSVWKPYRQAEISILFDYGIDDIRENLKFIKKFTGNKGYSIGGKTLHTSIDTAISMIEEDSLEKELKDEVITLWNEIEDKFNQERTPKVR
jgi:RecA/RadA recombinase